MPDTFLATFFPHEITTDKSPRGQSWPAKLVIFQLNQGFIKQQILKFVCSEKATKFEEIQRPSLETSTTYSVMSKKCGLFGVCELYHHVFNVHSY